MGIIDDDKPSGQTISGGQAHPSPEIPQVNPEVFNHQNSQQSNNAGSDYQWYARSNAGQPFGAIIGQNMGGEMVTSLRNQLINIYASSSKEWEFSVIAFDRDSNTGLYFSCIVVMVKQKNSKRTPFFTLILEGTNKPLNSVNRSTPSGVTVEITRLASDAADKALFRLIRDKLEISNAMGEKRKRDDIDLARVDSMVIPADFDVNNKEAVHQIAYIAALACGNDLGIHVPSFEDINVAKLARASVNSALSIYVNYGRSLRTDAVGMPVRSDVRCIFKDSTQVKNNDLSVNTVDQSTYMAELNGYMDLVYVGGNEINPYMPNAQQVRMDNYACRFVITDIDRLNGYTPANLLLALSTASALSADNNWMMAFRPQSMDRRAIDITDIGALGYENNVSNDPAAAFKKFDTKAENFTFGQLTWLLSTLLKPGIMISMDVPDSAPQTWYMSLFGEADRGNMRAREMIVRAAHHLTDGKFPIDFNMNELFIDQNNRIHLGYYISKNGDRRDIREIDYLAIANLAGENDREKIIEWSDTFTRLDRPLEVRLADRKRIIMWATDNTAVFTGWAQRVTIGIKFLDTLVNSTAACGLRANLVQPMSSGDFSDIRGRASFVGNGLFSGRGYTTNSISEAGSIFGNMNNMRDTRW